MPEAEKERQRVTLKTQLRARLTEKNAPLLGQTVDVLVESIEKNGRRHGRTPDCKPVFVDGSAAQPGDAIAARIVWAGPFSLVAAAT